MAIAPTGHEPASCSGTRCPNQGRTQRRLHGDRAGASVVTMLLLIPLFLGVINITIVTGQLMVIKGDLQQASREGVRVASLRNNSTQANADGGAAALAVLADQGVNCSAADADLTSSAFGPGEKITLRVTCQVPLADLGVGVPFLGTKTMNATSAERLERFREFD